MISDMDLYFLRNAKAVKSDGKNGGNDEDRYLSKKGERKMVRIAKGMRDFDMDFDSIITSPLLRASQSAEIVADAYRMKKHLHYSPHLAPRGNPADLIKEINQGHSQANGLLLVGHEASMGSLISTLLVGDGSLKMAFKRGGLCKLWVEKLHYGKCALLCWMLTPVQLMEL